MKQILIIGNGFDLKCGLKSTYKDFFNWKFNQVYNKKEEFIKLLCSKRVSTQYKKLIKNSLYDLVEKDSEEGFVNLIEKHIRQNDMYQIFCKLKPMEITFWDLVFILAKYYLSKTQLNQWQDIENIIYNVVSFAFDGKNMFKTNLRFSQAKERLTHFRFNDLHKNPDFDIRTKCKETFKNDVKLMAMCEGKGKNISVKTNFLLSQLYVFESSFAKFIDFQVNENRYKYESAAKNLIFQLTKSHFGSIKKLHVLSFNYSLDNLFSKNLRSPNFQLVSWRNIHGVANVRSVKALNKNCWQPIFGIDNHDLLGKSVSNDPRIMFTKSYRLLDNDINSLNKYNHSTYDDADLITIFGHGLGRADYSYFESIFDENNLYNSSTVLQVYYNSGSDDIKDKHKCITAVVNLLNNYGQTLSDTHGDNIVNKMILENRLEVLPSKKIVIRR